MPVHPSKKAMPPVDAGPRAGWAVERVTKPVAAGRFQQVGVVLPEKGVAPRVAALPVRVRLVEMVAVPANRRAGRKR
ncbi:hypothetical protein AA11826_2022 [Komagataeibacter oboediens DSM 11826]|nr:hypothetical protein AA11826_2022 [Komagataeibacter oboediens DSM 11826]